MRHTKPFTRRLACALWLTIGVWVPVEATEVCLSADRSWLREDAGRTEITVTAVHYPANTNCGNLTGVNPSAVNSDTYINLTSSTQGLNARFRIEFLSTVIIRQGESQASATVVLTPIEDGLMGDDAVDDGLNDDLDISIYGSAGTGINVQTSPLIWLLDDDKASTWIYLSVSPSELSTKAGPTPIVVTAMLNGQRASSHLNLTLVIDESNSSVKRDADFGASGLGAITIRKNRSVGTATITIDPKDNKPGVISLAVTGLPSGLNYWQVSPIVVRQTGPRITQVTLSPSSVREEGGPTNVTVTATLEASSSVAETVFFYFSNTVPPTLARAERDVDYDASWSNSVVTVPAGQTQATTTVRITPKDNGVEDGGKSIGVVASDSRIGAVGISSEAFLTILDDEASSESIVLSASPATIREDAGATTVTITADLQGGVLNNDVTLVFQSDAGTAVRDVDYQRPRLTLTIPAGQTQGRGEVTITPDNDGLVEPNETIIFQVASQPQNEYGDPITVGTVTVTLTDSGEKAPPPGDTTPTFAGTVSDLSFTVGSPITPVVLPQATGDAPMSYSLSALPAGLTFNKATRTLSGTPTSPATADMVYTVIDGDASAPESAALRFTIRVRARPPDTVAVQSLTASHSSIREDGAPVAVTLTVTLAGVSAVNETVTFDFLDGTGAERDTDYDVQLPSGKSITIPAGQTKGTIGITLTPINNTKADGNRTVRIQATVSGGTATVGITITDDETQSAAITLSVRPRTISETGGRASVTVTATLAGKALTQDTTVLLSVDYAGSTAERDLDYASLFSPDPHLVIPAGSTRGTRLFIVQPVVDGQPEGDETIRLIGTASGLVVQGAEITLSEQAPTTTTTTEPTTTPTEPATSSSGATADQEYTVGVSIPPLVLKAVAGGTYGVSGLPEGLSFDPDTRTISGTPTKATNGPVTVTVALIDAAGQVTTTTFTIKVSTSAGSSDSSLGFTATIANQVYTVGSSIPSLVLPVATGGTGTLSYGISGLPEGLSFDRTTRTISGTPTAETNGSVTVTYTAIDEAGNTAVTTFSITVNPGLDLGGFFDLFGKAVALPTEFVLADNSPNPFNPQTMIRYALPQAADVELTVYNVVGQPVRTLVAQHQHAGLYAVEWDATDDRGHRLSSGVYLYRLQAGEFREVKKMLLLK